MLLSEAWSNEAERWAKWARKPGHDSYWKFHRDQFLELVPPPGQATVDIGCGEGRLTRHLKSLGHQVIGIDVSSKLIALARAEDPATEFHVANAASLPLPNDTADLAIAFMSLQDVDDLQGAVAEAARILRPGGKFVLAIVHPINSAGLFASEDATAEFVIKGDYLGDYQYSYPFERDGLAITFFSQHRPLEAYSRALERSGFLIEALREHKVPDSAAQSGAYERWQRLPLFLHIRACKPEIAAR